MGTYPPHRVIILWQRNATIASLFVLGASITLTFCIRRQHHTWGDLIYVLGLRECAGGALSSEDYGDQDPGT